MCGIFLHGYCWCVYINKSLYLLQRLKNVVDFTVEQYSSQNHHRCNYDRECSVFVICSLKMVVKVENTRSLLPFTRLQEEKITN